MAAEPIRQCASTMKLLLARRSEPHLVKWVTALAQAADAGGGATAKLLGWYSHPLRELHE